jgi:hypothetical protein
LKYKEQNVLKTISIIILIYSGLQVTVNLVSIITTVYSSVNSNPLIPKYLYKYVAFRQAIILIVFLIVFLYTYRSLKKTIYNRYLIVLTSAIVLLKILFFGALLNLLNIFNPFGS